MTGAHGGTVLYHKDRIIVPQTHSARLHSPCREWVAHAMLYGAGTRPGTLHGAPHREPGMVLFCTCCPRMAAPLSPGISC